MAKSTAAAASPRTHQFSSRTVKVSPNVHDQLAELVTEVSQHGWKRLGVQRGDVPTFSTIIEEALKRFKRRT